MPVQATPVWIAKPLNIVDQLLENNLPTYQNDASALRSAVQEAFQTRIKGDTFDYRYLVPLINGLPREQLKEIPASTLIRFRCMVQDERPSSYHQDFLHIQAKDSGEIKVVCAMFKDGVALETDEAVVSLGNPGSLSEVRSLKCIPLPAETGWSRQLNQHGNSLSIVSRGGDPLPSLTANFFADAGKDIGVNDAIELFGVLVFHEEMLEEPIVFGADQDVQAVSPAEVRLNVFVHEILTHSHPALPLDKKGLISMAGEDGFSFAKIRAALIDLLRTNLGDDPLAAEYLLLHLLSTVYARPDGQAIGNFPLNLSGVPQDVTFVQRLLSTLESIVTKMVTFPLGIESLNTAAMTPKVSEATGTNVDHELLPGLLQLPKHTHFVLDELGMSVGTLNDTGCRNLIALQKLVNEQKLEFDFLFGQRIPFLMDIPVLVLSQVKSLITCHCIVPLTQSGVTTDQLVLAEEVIWGIRQYLVSATFLDYEISNDMREAIVEKFVNSRKVDRSISPESLHQQLELARYMTISHGESVLTKERWLQVLQLEEERLRRLKESGAR